MEDPDDVGVGVRLARGVILALALSIPVWVLLFFLLRSLLE